MLAQKADCRLKAGKMLTTADFYILPPDKLYEFPFSPLRVMELENHH